MAIQFQTDAGVLITPGAYFRAQVQNIPSNTATSGVLIVVGEAAGGPRFSEETDLSLNKFGPDQVADVTSKYGSGPLVDAIRGAATAANDPNITGGFSGVIPVKTNASTAATAFLPKIGGGNYAQRIARRKGADGNLISGTIVPNSSEIVPSTGAAIIAPPQVSTNVEFRVNGGAALTASLTVGELPSAIATAIDALAGVACSGGVNRAVLTSATRTVTVAIVSGRQATLTISTTWDNVPQVGDILYLPTGSPFASANKGTWVVLSATASVITAYKLLDAAGAGGSITNPVGEGPISIAATTDVAAFSPLVISSEAGAVVDGLGKTLEIANTTTGSFQTLAFTFASASASPPANPATWVSQSGTPTDLTSSVEYSVALTSARQSDSTSNLITAGGSVVLQLGYTGTTAVAVVANGVMTITVTGGTGVSQTLNLASFVTINNLVAFLNSQAGYTASAGSAVLGQQPATSLDAGTYGIASKWGAKNGRIKADGAAFFAAVNASDVLATVAPISPATALVGLPDIQSLNFLSGGAAGGTSNADILAALTACQGVRGNFVVTLFSVDAAQDITDGLTDSSSSYTVASVNANLLSHVLLMSQLKQRRPRQGFASFRGTYAQAKAAAGNIASSRVSLCFQDVKDVNSQGTLVQFRPWMAAAKAAGMQAAGSYRDITAKFINISGAIQAAGDWNDQTISQTDDALQAGLLAIIRDENGGFKWLDDQTTYTVDSNFVFNSIQAMYAADTVGATLGVRMERAFVGQSVADVSAALALTVAEGILYDLKVLKFIAPSDGAEKGWTNLTVRILNGSTMLVGVEVKLATGIKFVFINTLVTPVQQSASASG